MCKQNSNFQTRITIAIEHQVYQVAIWEKGPQCVGSALIEQLESLGNQLAATFFRTEAIKCVLKASHLLLFWNLFLRGLGGCQKLANYNTDSP